MNIGINALIVGEGKSGVGYYSINIIKEITKSSDYYFYIFVQDKSYLQTEISQSNCKVIEVPLARRGKIGRLIAEQLIIPFFQTRYKLDIIHSMAFSIPIFARCINIVTVHDLVYKIYPQTIKQNRRYYYNLLFDLSMKRADKIISVSSNTKKDIIKYLKIESDKIVTILEGVDNERFNSINVGTNTESIKEIITKKYILFVGNVEPRKNLATLLKAFSAIHNQLEHDLVIVGARGWKNSDVFDVVEKLNLHDRVIFTGFIKDDLLPILYRKADLFVFPSIYEGFGLPVLEAMASGTPVISSNSSSLPEVVKDAALLFDPLSEQEISECILKIVNNNEISKKFIQKGFRRVDNLSWSDTAEKTIEIYSSYYKNKNIELGDK
jgi:glycosyltransferase involved in cell wall biosynthesis